MEIIGKIIKVLDTRSGEGKHGPWMIATYLLETSGSYPKKMVFDVSGEDRIKRFNVNALMSAQSEVTVFFDIDAREYNGRWFNQIRAYDVRLANEKVPETAEEANALGAQKTDDLPY